MGTGKISNNNNNKNTGTKFETEASRQILWINIRECVIFTLEGKAVSSHYERDSCKKNRD